MVICFFSWSLIQNHFPHKMHKRRIDLFVCFFSSSYIQNSHHFPHKMHRSRRMGSTCRSFTQELAPEVWFCIIFLIFHIGPGVLTWSMRQRTNNASDVSLPSPWVCGKERCARTPNGNLSTLSPPDPLGCTHCQESLILFLCCGDNIFLKYICIRFNIQHCNVHCTIHFVEEIFCRKTFISFDSWLV